jgi:hypothetical protein
VIEGSDGSNIGPGVILNSAMSTRIVGSHTLSSYNAPDSTLMEQIEYICYDLLESNQRGWDLEDGSFGEFIFDVENDTILLAYNERFTDSRLTTAEF